MYSCRKEVLKIKEIEKAGLASKHEKKKADRDFRGEMVAALSDDDVAPAPVPVPAPAPAPVPNPVPAAAAADIQSTSKKQQNNGTRTAPREKNRKRPLLDLVRENHEAYNSFITKKVPKLLRALGVSSDEDSA